MATRRNFIEGILTVGGLAMTPMFQRDIELPDGIEADTTSYPPFALKYKGFQVYWTGWKQSFNTDQVAGQWCAYEGEKYDPTSRHFYASYPGDVRQAFPGDVFDVSVKEGQELPVWGTSEEKKKQYMLETLQRLMALIDSAVVVAE
jgi:hypothetical protein